MIECFKILNGGLDWINDLFAVYELCVLCAR